jgi:hypothetical protein
MEQRAQRHLHHIAETTALLLFQIRIFVYRHKNIRIST